MSFFTLDNGKEQIVVLMFHFKNISINVYTNIFTRLIIVKKNKKRYYLYIAQYVYLELEWLYCCFPNTRADPIKVSPSPHPGKANIWYSTIFLKSFSAWHDYFFVPSLFNLKIPG